MVAVKAHNATAYLKSPDPRTQAFLFFGTDPGLVSERSQGLAKLIAERDDPPGEILRLDDADLENDADKLEVELRTIPMFGGRKIVRAITGRRINALLLKPLVAGEPLAGVLIVEAGNLKPDDALRLAFERAPGVAAIACYADDVQDLGALVHQMTRAAGVAIAPDAQQLLVARLGADRTLSRIEIEKLIIYAHGKPRIEVDDVEAIVGDAAEQAIDGIVLATASGDAARAVNECGRAVEAGESAQSIILALHRYYQRLHRLRVALDGGKPFEDAIRALKPPVYFKHKPILAAQLRAWPASLLTDALTEIAAAAKSARLASALEEPIAERLVWGLAQRVARK